MPRKSTQKNIIDILEDAEVSVKAECLTATILELSISCDKDEQTIAPLRESIIKALANIAQHHIRSLQEAITQLMQHGHEHEEIDLIDNCLNDLHFSIEAIKYSSLTTRYLHPLIYGLRYVAERLEHQIDNLPNHLNGFKEAHV